MSHINFRLPHETHGNDPVSSRTRSRIVGPSLAAYPSAVPAPDTLDDGESDDAEDSDYADTDSDTSSTDSQNSEDDSIDLEEVRRLHLPLGTWERSDLEAHVPLDIVHQQFPETRPERHVITEFICVSCQKPIHDDDWFSPESSDPDTPDYEARQSSGEYCIICFRLKPDFTLRAGFCICRCRCVEVLREIVANHDSSDEVTPMPDENPYGYRETLAASEGGSPLFGEDQHGFEEWIEGGNEDYNSHISDDEEWRL